MALDTAHVKHGAASVKMTVAAGGTATLTRDNLGWDLSRERGALQLWVYMDHGAPTRHGRPWNLYFGAVHGNDTAATTSRRQQQEHPRRLEPGALLRRRLDGQRERQLVAADQRLRFSFSAPTDRSVEMSFDELRLGVRGLMPAFLWTFDDGYDEIHQDVLPYLVHLGPEGHRVPDLVVGTAARTIDPPAPPRPLRRRAGRSATIRRNTRPPAVDQATAAARDPGLPRTGSSRTAFRGPRTTSPTRTTSATRAPGPPRPRAASSAPASRVPEPAGAGRRGALC